jgi:hypothetical protein
MTDRKNTLFEGSSVVSGEATALVVRSGKDTEFGKIATRMGQRDEASAFQIGIRHFGYLLMRMTFVLSAGILIFNLFFHKPVVESILFSIALAVGLAPNCCPPFSSPRCRPARCGWPRTRSSSRNWRPSRISVRSISSARTRPARSRSARRGSTRWRM